MWPEPWVLAKSPSLSSAPSPPSTQPLPGCLSLHNGRFSAEISRYWIPGLEFCPPTMSRQRSMLQGRHTLQAKSWKTIPPFISIRKGEKKSPSPTYPFFSITPFPPHLSPVSKPEGGCQARSSSTRTLWFVGLLRRGESLKYHWENKHKLLIPIRFYRLSSKRKAITRKAERGAEDGVKIYSRCDLFSILTKLCGYLQQLFL